jgi:putative endonuclease
MPETPPPKRSWWRRWFGTRSERAAARFLRRLGLKILARNYRCPLGEIDLIALDGRCVVFVEVRSTSSEDEGRAALSVDEIKQRKLTSLALSYLREKRLLEHAARIDVLTICWPARAKEPRITHYPAAFEVAGRFQMYS